MHVLSIGRPQVHKMEQLTLQSLDIMHQNQCIEFNAVLTIEYAFHVQGHDVIPTLVLGDSVKRRAP